MNSTKDYLIINNGKLGRHFKHCFSLLGKKYQHWNRKYDNPIPNRLYSCGKILLLVPDDRIVTFIVANDGLSNITSIHFLGSLTTPLTKSAHLLFGPLMREYLSTKQMHMLILEKDNNGDVYEAFFIANTSRKGKSTEQ